MLAYDYPILGLFWSMLIFFLWVAWFVIFFQVVIDIFRSHDMGGWAKAGWFLLVLLVPFLGVFIYVIARGDSMRDRGIARAQAQQDQMDAYIQQAAGSGGGVADELAKLNDLKADGVISQDEFEAQKAKLLA